MGWTPAGNDAYEKLIIIFAGNPGVYIFETKILKPFSDPPGVNRTEQISLKMKIVMHFSKEIRIGANSAMNQVKEGIGYEHTTKLGKSCQGA